MTRPPFCCFAIVLAALSFASGWTRLSASDDLFLVAAKAVPESADDLRVLEEAVETVATKALACTVGVQVGNNFGSGVVISEDGLVLTAAHVTARPGRRATLSFSDGTTVAAKTLGMNMEADGALMQITEEGKWPHASLVSLDDYPRPGDWCIATGHPGGFDDQRTPPVRLGRLIDVNKYILRSDCTINSGDSGGPLFDIEGRVIGIHSRISEENTVNLHGPVLEFLESWKQMKAGEIYPKLPASRFLAKLDANGDGKITRAEQKDDTRRGIYDRIVEKYKLDADATHSIDDLLGKFEWREVEARLEIRPYDANIRNRKLLPRERFIRGKSVRDSFKPLIREVSKSLVAVRCNDKTVAWGTVVPQGIITKASQLSGDIVCKTHDGRDLKATIAHSDNTHDIALLELEEGELPVVEWSQSTPAIGSWLITPGLKSGAMSVGVMSVSARKIQGTGGVLGVQIGDEGNSTLIVRVFDGSGAANAGLKPDDVITQVFDKRVENLVQLKTELGKYHPGDIVKTKVRRADQELDFEVRLGMPEDVFIEDERFGSGRLNGELSHRRVDFPDVIQHDSVLQPNQCGGPVLDLEGRVVAINIARADRIATYAVPCRTIQALLDGFGDDAEEQAE